MTHQTTKQQCPFIKKPFNNCYCFNLTSKTISPAITYCGGKFSDCDLYKNNSSGIDTISTGKGGENGIHI